MDELTAARNQEAFKCWYLRPTVITPTARRDQPVDVYGSFLQLPVLTAPIGGALILWPRGECEVARSGGSWNHYVRERSCDPSDRGDCCVREEPKWLQLFVYSGRALTEKFVERVLARDYQAVSLTVDAPLSRCREREIRNVYILNPRLTLRTTLDTLRHIALWVRMVRSPRISLPNFQKEGLADFVSVAAYASNVLSSEGTPDDVRWFSGLWSGPLVIKGVTTAEDAKRVVDLGADEIQVSNNGGRQFDGHPGALEMLPAVVAAVGDRVPVFFDGGIRRGTDVLKAIWLGATACFSGTAHLWGLGIGGGEGVVQALKALQSEIDRAMAYGGWQALADVKNNGGATYPPVPSEGL